RDPPDPHRSKPHIIPEGTPSLGSIFLSKGNNSVRLPNDSRLDSRFIIPSISVSTGRDVLATIYFGEVYRRAFVYSYNITVADDSFLEFDISGVSDYSSAYIFTTINPIHDINRIGFYHKDWGRRRAFFRDWHGDGSWYRIAMDKDREWNPPPVPEPSAYGAVLSGLGLGAVVLNRRRVKKARRGINLGSVHV
ncbi:PEP-CTERM sorting domain-containing protein, partial [Cephaloticoccus capnophilus]|uniref:PEP-CTERM sorting domain-containing protein n=1 Tax=Cephaloticoccus capnophilus TaxID=1548208 RepID=UPI001E388B10